jgi:hypothetical protein
MRGIGLARALCVLVAIACGAVLAPTALAKPSGPVTWRTPVLADHSLPLSTPTSLRAVACPTSTTCLSVGANGTVVTTNGNARSVASGVDGGATLEAIACPSTSLCVIQEPLRLLVSTNPTAAHPAWKRTVLPLPRADELTGIACASNTLCVSWLDDDILEGSSNPAAGASAWKAVTLTVPQKVFDVRTVACAPVTTLCVASLSAPDGVAAFATSTNPTGGAAAWPVTTKAGFDSPDAIACPSATLCAAASLGDIETTVTPAAGAASWSAGAVVDPMKVDFSAFACPSLTVCLGALNDGSVATTTNAAAGSAGYVVSPVLDPAGFGTGAQTGIACPTTAACLIPDQTPGLATVTLGPPPAATVATGLGGTTAITGLSCPAAALCVGVDDGGGILRTAKPTGPASGWHRSVQAAAKDGLNDVSCPTTRFCAAVGDDDRVATSSHPGSSTKWTTFKLPFTFDGESADTPYDLEDVSCPSAKFCLVGNSEFGLMESTTPASGPSGWHFLKLAAFNADFWDAISCPTTSFCVAGDGSFGRIAVSTHPTKGGVSWHLMKIAAGNGSLAPGISSVSCPSTTFCLAGDGRGAIHWSTNPNGGPSAWHQTKVSGGRLIAASCRSRTFCVVINARHDAYASTDPTGGKSAWHDVALPTGHFPIASAAAENLRSLACAPHKVCVAGSGAGVVFPGTTAK